MSRNRYFAQKEGLRKEGCCFSKGRFHTKGTFYHITYGVLLPVLNSFKCLIIHYTTFVRKDFKPFCAKFRPVGLKMLNKTFLSYEKCSFCERNVPFAKGTFLSVYSHTGIYCITCMSGFALGNIFLSPPFSQI